MVFSDIVMVNELSNTLLSHDVSSRYLYLDLGLFECLFRGRLTDWNSEGTYVSRGAGGDMSEDDGGAIGGGDNSEFADGLDRVERFIKFINSSDPLCNML